MGDLITRDWLIKNGVPESDGNWSFIFGKVKVWIDTYSDRTDVYISFCKETHIVKDLDTLKGLIKYVNKLLE